jgi:hypothetical protein
LGCGEGRGEWSLCGLLEDYSICPLGLVDRLLPRAGLSYQYSMTKGPLNRQMKKTTMLHCVIENVVYYSNIDGN